MSEFKLNKGIVAYHTTMSLDGFIAGPDYDMSWIFEYEYPNDLMNQIISNLGALIVG